MPEVFALRGDRYAVRRGKLLHPGCTVEFEPNFEYRSTGCT
jgi:hypothetical protein